MFEKLLGSVPYNPALVQELSFYGRRMKQESSVRRTGVLFLLLAFTVQFFAFVSPPQATLADSSNDLINGGITSAADATAKCNANTQNYKLILADYGISCNDLSKTSTVTLNSVADSKQLFSMGRLPYGQTNIRSGKPTSETPVTIPGVGTLYLRYLWSFDTGSSSNYTALQGTSSTGNRSFYVLYNCANLVFVNLPAAIPVPAPAPTPRLTVIKGVKLHTQSQGIYYKNITATPKAVVDYSIDLYNTGGVAFPAVTVRDTLPAGVIAVPGSLAVDGQPTAASVASINSGPLASGQYKRLTFSATIPNGSQPCTTYTNLVSVSAGTLPVTHDTADVQACQPTTAPGPVTTPTPTPVTPPVTIPPTTPVPSPCMYNVNLAANSPECKPCDKAVSTSNTLACIVRHKSAANLTQNLSDANNTTAHAGDKIVYTLSANNQGKAMVDDFSFEENLSDVLDYADVSNLYGATQSAEGVIVWPKTTIAPGQVATVKLEVTVKSPIPSTPQVQGTGRYDHVMTNVYENSVNINVPQTALEQAVTTAADLPNTGPGTSVAVAAGVLVLAGYFYARSRLLASEAFLAVQDNNSGGF